MTKMLTENAPEDLQKQISEVFGANKMLQESLDAATAQLVQLRLEDQNWRPLYGRPEDDDTFSLENLKEVAKTAEIQLIGNPLLQNGLRVRTSNVFGKGLAFDPVDAASKVAPRFQDVLDKPANQRVLQSQSAYERNEREIFAKGNLFMAYRKSTKTFFPIPFKEITGHASNPELVEDVWYFQRTWTEFDFVTQRPKDDVSIVWYPVLEHAEEGVNKLIDQIGTPARKVDKDVVIIDLRVNNPVGTVWGVPDCLAAMPYAWAHAQYIRNASKLLEALSTIAWKVVARSKANSANAATKMNSPKRNGSTATMTEGTDLVAMPKAGQVDMKDGQVIASYVAAALGISLVALLQDAGAASGSYGAAASLDGPSANTARSRQALWVTFYERCYRAVGVKSINVNFPKLTEDPIFRSAQTLALAFTSGFLFQDEARDATLELLDIKSQHDGVPDANIFTKAAQYSLEAIAAEEKQEKAQIDGSPTYKAPTQAQLATGTGQATGVGSLSNGDNSTRDQAAKPGTGGK